MAARLGGVILLCNAGLGPGLIDHNTFTAHHGADEVIHNNGTGSPTNYGGWSVDVTPGGPNTLFVENNTFTYPSSSGYFDGTSAMENFYGATVVFRYNTVNDMQIDIHGSSPGVCSGGGTYGNENSGRWWEVYDNTFNVSGINQSSYAVMRGGSGVVFSNHVAGTNTSLPATIEFTDDCTSGVTWPVQAQVGRGINTTVGSPGTSGMSSPAYAWGNDSSMAVYSGNTTYVLSGATPASCAHSPCDVVSTASQPVTLTRCESAADVSAGCPVSYSYTPYTYPHPLAK